jgi:hypothetical protein
MPGNNVFGGDTMTEEGKAAWLASVMGFGALVAGFVFGILISFIVAANVLAIIDPTGQGPIGEGFMLLPLLLVGLLAGLCVGMSGWIVLWENRARDVRWRVHRRVARTLAVCTAIVLAGCAEAVGLRPETPAFYRVLLVGGIVAGGCGMVAKAFRWNRGGEA